MQPPPGLDPNQTHVATELKHDSPLLSCRFDPQGRFVFASAEDRSVQRWALGAEGKVGFTAHDGWVLCLATSLDGETLVTAGSDGRLIWWPAAAEKPAPLHTVEAHAGWVRSIAVSPDGQLLASAGNDRRVKLWKMSDASPVAEFTGHEAHAYSVWFHPGGEFVVSGDLKGSVKQWKIADGSTIRSFDAKALHSYNGGQQVDFGGVRTLALNADASRLACGGLHKAENPLGAVHEPLVVEFEWDSQKQTRSYVAEGVKGAAWRVMYHAAGFLIGVSGGSSGGFLLFWKPDQDKEVHRFKLPNLARDLDLHPDGLQVATAHYDRVLRISRMAAKS